MKALNPNGIEPIFLNFDPWSPGAGFYSYYNFQCIKLDKEKIFQEKKSLLIIQKTFNAVFKNGINSTPTLIHPSINSMYNVHISFFV